MSRRSFLKTLAVGLSTSYTLTAWARQGILPAEVPGDQSQWFRFLDSNPPQRVFGLSVASGDPSPTGVVLWTRVNPETWADGQYLAFEVALDDRFTQPVARGLVASRDFGADKDYTLNLDLDGRLQPDSLYYYRFIFGQTASRTGRCRTLPAPGAARSRLRLGAVTCQDFTNGYYGAFHHLAQEDLDFVVHMGDFIYETSGDPRFQPQPYVDRRFSLPSGGKVAMDLQDYRFLYRTYRADRFLQEALERHTFIFTWDDHETANDCYWDAARDTLGAPDHPLTLELGNDAQALRQLRMAAMRAWKEYVPARIQVNESADHPHRYFSIHRGFSFGGLVDLFMTEGRSHRSPHPDGEGTFWNRYVAPDCDGMTDPTHTMLGPAQRDWLSNGILASRATWKLWGNPVFSGVLKMGAIQGLEAWLDFDAWDGYQAERHQLMQTFKRAGVRNLVTLTGDLHTTLAGYMKVDYRNPFNTWAPWNLVGVEFMTPSVTSATLKELVETALTVPNDSPLSQLDLDCITEDFIRLNNPHVKFFESSESGYSVLEFTPSDCTFTVYAVDKSVNAATAPRRVMKRARVPQGTVRIDML